MLKEAREIKNKMIEDAKTEAQDTSKQMIAQAQAAIEVKRKRLWQNLKAT